MKASLMTLHASSNTTTAEARMEGGRFSEGSAVGSAPECAVQQPA